MDKKMIRRPDSTPTEHAVAAPWLESVEVPQGARWLFVSGQVPPIVDTDADITMRSSYGDMETQCRGVLRRVQEKLQNAGYGLRDIVKMNGYLVGEEALNGEPDLEGFGRAYREFFNTAEPSTLHARTRIQVAKLMNPAWLVEIEVIAAKID